MLIPFISWNFTFTFRMEPFCTWRLNALLSLELSMFFPLFTLVWELLCTLTKDIFSKDDSKHECILLRRISALLCRPDLFCYETSDCSFTSITHFFAAISLCEHHSVCHNKCQVFRGSSSVTGTAGLLTLYKKSYHKHSEFPQVQNIAKFYCLDCTLKILCEVHWTDL